MKFPIIICHHNILTIARADYFNEIGLLDAANGKLEIGISSRGQAGFQWLVDADGLYYPLHWDGHVAPTLAQRLGLKRKREAYSFPQGAKITVGKMREILASVVDENTDLPHHDDLIKMLSPLDAATPITPKLMAQYLGE